jgi:prepilin-type N-terminal cleavage/methylation domain-containing protein
MRRCDKSTHGGFTVPELLIALLISAMAMGGVFSSFLMVSKLFYSGTQQMKIQEKARYAIEQIGNGISAAEVISIQGGGNRIHLTVPITTLTSDISSSATTIPVEWTQLLPAPGVAYIDNETIAYSGKTDTSLLSCSRGSGGTSASSHSEDEIVYIKPAYYLHENAIYLDMNGTISPSTDQLILPDVKAFAGRNLFQLIGQSAPYNVDRVQVAFGCFKDTDDNNVRDPNEPGLDFELEFFARNLR